MFDQYDELPPGFLETSVENLHEILPKPTLIHLKGESDRPIFICTLLHGNETTGFYALQKLLRTDIKQKNYPNQFQFLLAM